MGSIRNACAIIPNLLMSSIQNGHKFGKSKRNSILNIALSRF